MILGGHNDTGDRPLLWALPTTNHNVYRYKIFINVDIIHTEDSEE